MKREVTFTRRPEVRPEYENLRRYGLFEGIVFGPVRSRRLGASLGINPLPSDEKICSFDCPYCECGRTTRKMSEMRGPGIRFPALAEISKELEAALAELAAAQEPPEALTLTGNGEPTMHPDFPGVVEIVRAARAAHAPRAKTVLLTNGTLLDNPRIRAAAARLDEVMVKLDGGRSETMQAIDLPLVSWSPERVVRAARDFPRGECRLLIQAIFLAGTISNTSEEDIAAWIGRLKEIRPDGVEIYTLDRVPEAPGLAKVPAETLAAIAARAEAEAGCPVRVS